MNDLRAENEPTRLIGGKRGGTGRVTQTERESLVSILNRKESIFSLLGEKSGAATRRRFKTELWLLLQSPVMLLFWEVLYFHHKKTTSGEFLRFNISRNQTSADPGTEWIMRRTNLHISDLQSGNKVQNSPFNLHKVPLGVYGSIHGLKLVFDSN